MSETSNHPMAEANAAIDTPGNPLPEGEYAIVEIMGHRTLIGRVTEIERFGTKLMQIEPVFADALLAPVLIGGSSIYQFTTCTREVAQARQPKSRWDLPTSIVATLPAEPVREPEQLTYVGSEHPEFDADDHIPF
jgi:hypothetical protein